MNSSLNLVKVLYKLENMSKIIQEVRVTQYGYKVYIYNKTTKTETKYEHHIVQSTVCVGAFTASLYILNKSTYYLLI